MNTKKLLLRISTAFILNVSISACNTPSGLDGTPLLATGTTNDGNGCFTDHFVQPTNPIANKIDILFVVHSTESFNAIHSKVVADLDFFVAHLPTQVDYRIAVMLANPPGSKWDGKLYTNPGYPVVLDSQTMSLTQIKTALLENVQNVVNESPIHGEFGTKSFYDSLQPKNFAAIQAQGFYRPDANLAVVFMANEADQCNIPLLGAHPDADDIQEFQWQNQYCNGLTPLQVVNQLKAVENGKPFTVVSVVFTDPKNIPNTGSEAEYGYGYVELARLANGMTVDIANGNFSAGMTLMGELTTNNLNLYNNFELSQTGALATTITASVDGSTVANYFNSTTNIDFLPKAGQQGSHIDINYCLLQTPPPSSSPGPGPGPSPSPTPAPSPSPTVTPCSSLGCGGILGV